MKTLLYCFSRVNHSFQASVRIYNPYDENYSSCFREHTSGLMKLGVSPLYGSRVFTVAGGGGEDGLTEI